MLGKLRAFKERYGHCRVPYRWKENPQLGAWVARERRRKPGMKPHQLQALEALGFAWPEEIRRRKGQRWLWLYRQLKAFREANGHARVPDQYAENPTLGKWVSGQRTRAREGRLSEKRKALLDGIGFEWGPDIEKENRLRWERMYIKLKRFYQQYGHARVPENWEADRRLASWVAGQRQHEKRLSAYRKGKLREVGFSFSSDLRRERERAWEEMYARLKDFHAQHGHCRVTIKHPDRKLFSWVAKQRRSREKLSSNREARLEALGFAWIGAGEGAKQQIWELRLSQLKAFKERFGHCRVPDRWPENKELANWVAYQRRKFADLSPQRQEKLFAAGFSREPGKGEE